MSNKSLKIELAVSIPPAPLPIIVCVPECSEVNEMAFNVPSTQSGSSFFTSIGLTISLSLHDAMSLIEHDFLDASFISFEVNFRIPIFFYILHCNL